VGWPSCWGTRLVKEWLSRRVPFPPSGTRRFTNRHIRRYAIDLEIVLPVRAVQRTLSNPQHPVLRLARSRLRVVALSVLLLLGVASARDSVLSSAYAPVVGDLLEVFQAEETLCPLATYQYDLCFEVRWAGASRLAELVEAVVADYEAAGLRGGGWRAANGVWSVRLAFGDGGYGQLELFLTEVAPGTVNGTFVFHPPR